MPYVPNLPDLSAIRTQNKAPPSNNCWQMNRFARPPPCRCGSFPGGRVAVNRVFFDRIGHHVLVPRWHGLRLVAADAPNLRFGLRASTVANPASANQIAFGLFLPGAEMMLAASLHSVHVNEHQMLFQHVDCLGSGDLLLMDRGYPCRLAPYTGNGASVALRPALAGIGTSHRQQNS